MSDRVLRTARYVLRPLTAADATARYLAWLQDCEVTRHLEVRHARPTLDSIVAYIASHDGRNSFLFGVFAPDSTHVGNYSLRVDTNNRLGTLGVMIGDRAHWGRDIVQETRAAILDFAFDGLGLHKVVGACMATNRPALYNYRRQGWAMEGIRKEHFAGADGGRVDVVEFGMLAAEWRTRRREP